MSMVSRYLVWGAALRGRRTDEAGSHRRAETPALRILSLIVMLGLLLFMGESCRNAPAQCPLCEREIHAHMQVSITHNGIPMKTCCMACALTYQAQTRNVEIQTATDFATDSPIDPRKAVWVVGSGISPCTQDVKVQKFIREPHAALHACYDRCEPGMLAFSKKSDAEKYQAENGGHLVEFDQLPSWLPVKGGQSHD